MSNHATATQNMFEVKTNDKVTDRILHDLHHKINAQVELSWLDMVRSGNYTVNILLETTQDVDVVSDTIATLIQTHMVSPQQ